MPRCHRHQRRRTPGLPRTRQRPPAHRLGRRRVARHADRPEHTPQPRGSHATVPLQSAGRVRDLNDAQRLRVDPAMRAVVGGRARVHAAASTSEIAWFETETLTTRANLNRLMDLSGQWIDRAHRHRRLTRIVLDMDSSVSETYGRQEGSAYNGHFGCTCYHPLFVFNQFGDLE